MRRSAGIVLAAAIALSGCAYFRPGPMVHAGAPPPPAPPPAAVEKVVKVRVPTPVKCVPDDLGAPPTYPDSDQALRDAGGAADRYQLLAAGRLLRDARLAKLEDIVKRCRQAARNGPSGG